MPGVQLAVSTVPVYDDRADWGKLAILTGVGGLKNDGFLPPQANISCAVPTNDVLPGGRPTLPLAPGDVHRRQMYSGYTDGNHKTSYANYPWYKSKNVNYLESSRTRPWDRFFEFEKLGTYVLYYHLSGIRSSTATLKPSQTFCDTARYVFHVGPVAELAVQNGTPPAGGYQVVARNNGPDPAERAQVHLNVTGMQATASVGRWDPATGIWDLSQAWDETNQQWVATKFYPDDEATLTFGAGSSRVTATIANHEQCVDEDGVVQAATTELACIYSDPTATPPHPQRPPLGQLLSLRGLRQQQHGAHQRLHPPHRHRQRRHRRHPPAHHHRERMHRLHQRR